MLPVRYFATEYFSLFVFDASPEKDSVKDQARELRKSFKERLDPMNGDELSLVKSASRKGWTIESGVSTAEVSGKRLLDRDQPRHVDFSDFVRSSSSSYPSSTFVYTLIKDDGEFLVQAYLAGSKVRVWRGSVRDNVDCLWNPETSSLECVEDFKTRNMPQFLASEKEWGWRLLETLAARAPQTQAFQALIEAGLNPPAPAPEEESSPRQKRRPRP